MFKPLIALLLLLFSQAIHAEWYETEGHAVVINGNKQQAKAQAIENALKKALLVAGATVSSVRQVVNGLLTEDELSIRASGNVQSLELLSESYQDNHVVVTIRADIFSQLRQCFSANYRKPIAITRSHILYREQANIGQIYAIDQAFTKQLSGQLNEFGQFARPTVTLNNKTGFARLVKNADHSEIKQLVMALASQSESQYVLFSTIDDISFEQDANNRLAFWQSDQFNRAFKLTVHLYNGANGEAIFEQPYFASAPWQFEKREVVDVSSVAFWQSQYGEMIRNLTQTMVNDLDELLMCEPTRATILAVNGKQVTVNMGQSNGVKIGDEFSLMHVQQFETANGKPRKQLQISPYKIKITQVSRDTAIGTSSQAIGNIQRNDLAVRY